MRLPKPQLIVTEEDHRTTTIEIFFDLVLVFALTRVITFMGEPPTPLTMSRGLLLLLLFWYTWGSYAWLGNQVRADIGLARAGILAAMLAVFLAALVVPEAWRPGDAALVVALAYIAVRCTQLCIFLLAARSDRRLLSALRLFATSTVLAWVPLLAGAQIGGTAQTLLWSLAFLIDYGGAWVTSTLRNWRMRSPGHFAERHGLIFIIALGESLIAAGVGASTALTRGVVLAAAALGLAGAACLWWLYFGYAARSVARVLADLPPIDRGRLGGLGYSLAHIPLIVGVAFVALGMEQVLARLAHALLTHQAGPPLEWTSTAALYGGLAVYLGGRVAFLRSARLPVAWHQTLACFAALALLPVARPLPALASLGLFTALLLAVVGADRRSPLARTRPRDRDQSMA